MTIKQIIFRIAITILVVEAIIMELLHFLSLNLTPTQETIFDASALVILSTPLIYIWVIRPFVQMRDEALQKVSYLSYHDELTNLPNRTKFVELLDYSINTSLEDTKISVIILEIERLQTINDTFGHSAVEYIIAELSKRVSSITDNKTLISRIGTNKFAFLIEHTDTIDTIYSFAKNILKTTSQPIKYEDHDFNLDAYIGISNYPKDATNKDNLLKYAHAAMGEAKSNKENNNISFHTQALTNSVHQHFMLEEDLRNAVDKNELFLLYQPKIDANTNELIGVEALVRWTRSGYGIVNPMDFIPIAEETGIIAEIGEWVLNEAIRQQEIWQSEGKKPIVMSINLSAKQLRPEQIVNIIQSLSLTTISAKYIEFEITETSIMDNPNQAQLLLEVLRTRGISIAMDDFGTGYSSFAYLKQLHVHILKIDRMLIADIEDDKDDFAIAEAIVAMAHKLNIKVVAEGVETKEQAEMLKSINCDYLQGYYYSKPVNPNSVYSNDNYTI